jgi:pSer/pThr/pTyr-binding forkhead associated (FHA) protein
MLSKVFYLLFLGGIGGVLGWMLTEPFVKDDIARKVDWGHLMLYGIATGGSIGAFIGFGSGLALGTTRHAFRGFGVGLVVGMLGGWFGVYFGQVLFSVFGATMPIIGTIIGRAVGWGAFGALVGLAEGAVGRSWRRARQGMIGGFIGGGIGGLLFDAIALASSPIHWAAAPGGEKAGIFSRAIALTVMGAAIGLFVGLLEVISRKAWIRVVMGRNEGKDYPLDRFPAVIGRYELAEVPLFGDVSVAPQHAQIVRQGGQYLLVDVAGTLINGQRPSQPVPLYDNDQIQVGSFTLLFRDKAGSHGYRPVDQPRSATPPPPSVPQGMCAFCGQRKDPVTGACACSVPAGTAVTVAQSVPTGYGAAPPILAPTATIAGQATALRAVGGVMAGQQILVGPNGLIVGREAGCDLVLPDSTVSRRHARVVIEGGTLVVYDEDSTNGTFVNEQRAGRQPLKPGDSLRFGGVQFTVE